MTDVCPHCHQSQADAGHTAGATPVAAEASAIAATGEPLAVLCEGADDGPQTNLGAIAGSVPGTSPADELPSRALTASISDGNGTGDNPLATLDADDLPTSVDFGPASQPWPSEPAGEIEESPSRTHSSFPTVCDSDATGDRQENSPGEQTSTVDAILARIRSESIAELWRGSHTATTSPLTTIRREDLPASSDDRVQNVSRPTIMGSGSRLRAKADYELLERIGEGGVGIVYAARQASIDRTVAVKMLKETGAHSVEQREKFLSEAVVTGDLDHPNIVPIYDLGSNDSGALFYSMKRVEGTPWVSVIHGKTLAENLEILMKVADAVAFAHSRGVVHRDIKPENVMLGEYGEVLLMDWGLALVMPEFRKADSVTKATGMGGTPAYMAPEMATGPLGEITRASDVYLLGAVLYEIITTQPPHAGKTVTACLLSAARNDIQPTNHSGELVDIALRAMARRPAERYASVRDFQAAVRNYQAHSESIVLSGHAEKELAEARQRGDYELFSHAVFGFQEACSLWEQNARATAGVYEAKLAYAECAAKKEDYDLALSLVDRFDPRHRDLVAAIETAQQDRATRQQRLRNAKRIVTALAATMLVVVTGALLWVSHLYGVADREAEIANREKTNAIKASREATLAKDRAVRNEQEAQEQRRLAEFAQRQQEYSAYIAQIGLAAAKVEENAFGEVDQLLEQCPPRLRNWEWGRLKFLCGRAMRTYSGDVPFDAVAFDNTGERFVSGSWDGVVRVWSVADSARPLVELNYGKPYIFTVAFSPDGRHVAAGGNDADGGYVKIWNIESGKLVQSLGGHTDHVLSVAYNADGTRLLTSSCDFTARLWDLTTGETLRTFRGHTWWVWSAAFSPQEDAVVTAGQDRKCIVWPISGGNADAKKLHIFTGHDGPVYSAEFSPDGQFIASGGYDNRVLVWRREEAKPFNFQVLEGQSKPAAPNFQTLAGHTAAVRSVRFSRRSPHQIVSASHDNTIKVWDFASGDLIQTLRGHAGWVRSCDVSPDGRSVISASHDREAKLWNLEGYEEVRVLNAKVLSGHSDAILSASFSADGHNILTSSRDRTARIWAFENGSLVKSLGEGHDFLASQAIVFRDGRRFLTSGIDSTVRIWDIAHGAEIRTLTGTGARGLVALSSDQQCILTASGENAILWDVESGEVVRTFEGHRAEIAAIALSPDNRFVFTGDVTGRTRLWDRATGEVVWDLKTHSDGVNGAAFTPDGRRVLTASNDNTVGQFDVATGEDLLEQTLKHGVAVTALAVSTDGRYAATNAADAKVRIWDLKRGRIAYELDDVPARVSNFSFSADGSKLVTVAPLSPTHDDQHAIEQHSLVQFWDMSTGRELTDTRMTVRTAWSAVFAPQPGQVLLIGGDRANLCEIGSGRRIMSFSPHGAVTSARYSPDETRIVTSGGDASAKVWDVARGQPLFKLALEHEGAINSAVYSPDGKYILTASDDRTARLWDAETGKLVRTYAGEQGHSNRVRSALFSTGGQYIITASSDNTARLWRASGELVAVLQGHKWPVVSAAFSRDGKYIVTGSEDNTARIWDAAAAKTIGELAGHTAAVTSVAFSADGLRVLTGSQDSVAKLWDAETCKEILTLKGHREEVTSVSFSSDGRYALTGSRDGTAIVWLTDDWRTPGDLHATR
jgi:WD40 repeat protein